MKVALVGCGRRAAAHVRACRSMTDMAIEACCDAEIDAARRFAAEFSIPAAFSDVDAMMAEVRPELVIDVTPPYARRSVVEAALRQGSPVLLLEKPIAFEAGEARQVLELAHAAAAPCFVNHQLRYFRAFERLSSLVADGVLGDIRVVRGSCRLPLLEQGPHLVDLVSQVLPAGDVLVNVLAQTHGVEQARHSKGHPDYTTAVLDTASGVRVYIECGSGAAEWPGTDTDMAWKHFGLEVIGERGTAGASLSRGWWVRTPDLDDEEKLTHAEQDDPAQRRLLATILEQLDAPEKHPCGPSGARASIDILSAVQQAGRTGSWVAIEGGRGAAPPSDVSLAS